MNDLTPEQRHIMDLTIQGVSVADICSDMNKSKRFVEHLRHKAIKALGGKNVIHAAVIYDRQKRGN